MASKAAFIDTHIVLAADVAGILAAGGLQAMEGFQSIWAYGQTTSTGVPTLATLAQTYIIPDMPAVEVFLAATGVRGHSMMDSITGVAGGPTITGQPVADSVTAPAAAAFVVTATGTGTLKYQWYETTAGFLTGEFNATLTIDPTDVGQDGNGYYCLVTDDVGVTQTVTAALTVA